MAPNAILSMYLYYVKDLGRESFVLPLQMWYVHRANDTFLCISISKSLHCNFKVAFRLEKSAYLFAGGDHPMHGSHVLISLDCSAFGVWNRQLCVWNGSDRAI